MKKGTFITILLVTLSLSAFAQGTPRLSLVLDEEKVNMTAAERSGRSDVAYLPGDTIRYMLTASNVGDALMTNPEIVDPVPGGTTYVPESAVGANCTIVYSIDGGSSYSAWPVTYEVRNARGERVTKTATPDMISHIKWNIQRDLAPGEAHELEFRVEVTR